MFTPRTNQVSIAGIGFTILILVGCAADPTGDTHPTATGGAPTGTGGVAVATGGKAAATGGGVAVTGGVPTGGIVVATGGVPVATGGVTPTIEVGKWLKCSQLTQAKMDYEYSSWKDKYLVACGTDKARVDFMEKVGVHTTNTVSEGIGYGVLLAAGMRDCPTVKKLYTFYAGAVAAKSASQNGNLLPASLMPWKFTSGCETNSAADANFASDGDLDVAMGLLQADAVCADAASYNYKQKALSVINALKSKAFTDANGMSAVKGGAIDNRINPSYFSPGYYRAFAKAASGDAAFWTKAATDALALLKQYQQGGKWMDWTDKSTSSYDAIRVPWRLATDYAWNPTAEAKALLDTYRTQAMNNQLPYAATAQADHNSAFVGAAALSAMSADQAKMDAFCADWVPRAIGFNIKVTDATGQLDDSPYYQGTLRVVYMLLASGYALSTL